MPTANDQAISPKRRGFGSYRTTFLILLGIATIFSVESAAGLEKSQGVYRIPYANGTSVAVTNDHSKHNPPGAIDMHGTGSKRPSRIVAAADGTLRFIVDQFSARIDSKSGQPCANNYVWIEHENGEWTKYSHMKKDSTTKDAKLRVGQRVKAGTFLGYEDDVGCASGPHLHFEVGVPRMSNPITRTGGFLQDNADRKRNRIPRICGVPAGIFRSGMSYKARNVPGNIARAAAEVARHGVPATDYQCLFDQAVSAGYELAWIDGFDVRGKVRYNVIFRPRGGSAWKAFHGLSGSTYQSRFNEYTRKGYRPRQVESYREGRHVRYAVIFKKAAGPPFTAYHGVSVSDHQQRFDRLTKDGWRPINLSVVSISGQKTYTALYQKVDLGSWTARSSLSLEDYQKLFDANTKSGRQFAYLNSYEHRGKPFFSAIWSSKPTGAMRARHGLTASQYQTAWSSNISAGFRTHNVTGYTVGSAVRFAAFWRK